MPRTVSWYSCGVASAGARLARINDERVYIDDIPADWPTTNPIAPECDLLCDAIRREMAEGNTL